MKRWVTIAVILIGLLYLGVILLFPKEVTSVNVVKIRSGINPATRYTLNENAWAKWWPGKVTYDRNLNKNIYQYGGYDYTITSLKYNAIQVETRGNDLSVRGTLIFIPLNSDSVQAEWNYSLSTNSNPINRIHLTSITKQVNDNMVNILESLRSFLSNTDRVYGMHIDETLVTDTAVMATKFSSVSYPSMQKIYEVIDSIKNYVYSHGAKETNSPMLHIDEEHGLYKIQVAIPVNSSVPGNSQIFASRLVPGKILVAEIKGGDYSAREAFRQMGLYMLDYNRSSPAIPFESLVTNRMQEPDTAKWITKIYYPVF